MFNLSGLVCLVTGSGQGMGLGIVRALAHQGAQVMINDLFPERAHNAMEVLLSEGYHNVGVAPGDITQAADRESIVTLTQTQFGQIDVLVHNAGVPPGMPTNLKCFQQLEQRDYEQQMALNFDAVRALTHAVLPHMQAQKFGRIITITSESWRIGLPFGLSNYAAAKSASLGMMRHLAHEVGRQGITCNALSLGTMNNFGDFQEYAKNTAVGRAGSPEDVGAAVVYLASREASWMTGQVIPLNGGSVTA